MKDAQTELRKEECALDTEQSATYAATMDAKIKFIKEECAGGTGHIALTMMNLLHLDQNLS